MALIKCSECGGDVSEKASVCLKCGCPVTISKEIMVTQKKKKIKNIAIGIIILVVIAITAIVIVRFIKRPNNGYYKDTQWGMTIEQVEKIAGVDADNEVVVDTIKDYDGKSGVVALIGYECTDDSLENVKLYLYNEDDSSYTYSKLINEYTESFNELYGEAEEAEEEKAGVTTFWSTSKSRIKLTYIMDVTIIITYEDITKIEE